MFEKTELLYILSFRQGLNFLLQVHNAKILSKTKR